MTSVDVCDETCPAPMDKGFWIVSDYELFCKNILKRISGSLVSLIEKACSVSSDKDQAVSSLFGDNVTMYGM